MPNLLEQGGRPTQVVPEAPEVRLGVDSVARGAKVIGNRPVEPVGGLRPVVENVVGGTRPAAPAGEVTPTPVK